MKEVNISYYQQLLDKGRYNPSDRNFYQKVLDSIKKQGGKATDRQYNIIQQIKFGKTTYSSKNEHIYNKNNIMNQTTQLRQLIKESIQEYIREVEASGNIAAQETKIRACDEAIALREKKVNMDGLDEAYHDMMDSSKFNELKKEVKELQKYKSKAEKVLDKMKTKAEGKMSVKSTEDEGMMDEVIDEVTIDPPSGPQLEENVDKEMYYEMAQQMKNDGMDYDETVERLEDMGVDNSNAEIIVMNVFKEMEEEMNIYEILHMQKLAGIISETEYKSKVEELEEAKKMTAAQKDKKEDIVKSMKKSKSFGKSKDEKSKMYATATKLATKKK
jgi:hypothetical protein